MSVPPPVSSEVLITRVFDAPRELVFRAWTDPEQLMQWYAPDGCTIFFQHIDVREGGRFHSCIRTPDGHECWCVGGYRAVEPPSRLVFTLLVANSAGELVEPVNAGMDPEWPKETVVMVTLAEQDGKTTLTLHQTVSEALAKKTGAYPSWLKMLDRLDLLLS